MRIVSYNILDGGVGRADPIAEVIAAQNADIVVLIEADDEEVLERLSRRLDMDYIRAQGSGRHAAAILSRWTIARSVNHGALRQGPPCLVEATIEQRGGEQWIVGAVHFHPRATEADELVRVRQMEHLLEAFGGYRREGRPHILAGDFNANSPIQHIDPALCQPATRQAWEANGGMIPRRAVSMLLDAGYADTLAVVAGEQTAGRSYTFTTQYPGQRIDYIFTFGYPRERLRSAWIEQDRLARFASDHYPVGLEIE